jgi:hypothetical protein
VLLVLVFLGLRLCAEGKNAKRRANRIGLYMALPASLQHLQELRLYKCSDDMTIIMSPKKVSEEKRPHGHSQSLILETRHEARTDLVMSMKTLTYLVHRSESSQLIRVTVDVFLEPPV